MLIAAGALSLKPDCSWKVTSPAALPPGAIGSRFGSVPVRIVTFGGSAIVAVELPVSFKPLTAAAAQRRPK